ncbi:hypothetical protein SARC_10020 [Sphaeroforma arctica JP610]|uniref:Uncharacterized protein n=1 Tax=Sphaeroforma arctica JP610 TaxID=667725 RepID=A0A0L0FNC7_9EUKA|nr:hypothetical protein SARC_10020 [Sphaeroforma arctica JP610]KNC77518.1 hypothetical protein SARC_10020 [Sphaeroforma arctica JP610]|eukprot:XP_014151420.1 hypothetical protein SARC_10020 [Sphaeroforma arctica JP610]
MSELDVYRDQTIFTRLSTVPVVSMVNELAVKKHAEALEQHALYKLASEYTECIVANAIHYAEPALDSVKANDRLKQIDVMMMSYFDRFVAKHPGVNITVEELLEAWHSYYESIVEPNLGSLRERAAPYVNFLYQKKDRLDTVVSQVKQSLGGDSNEDNINEERTSLVTFSAEVIEANADTPKNGNEAQDCSVAPDTTAAEVESETTTESTEPVIQGDTKIVEEFAKCVARTESTCSQPDVHADVPVTIAISATKDYVSAAKAETIEDKEPDVSVTIASSATKDYVSAAKAETIEDKEPDVSVATATSATKDSVSTAEAEAIEDKEPDVPVTIVTSATKDSISEAEAETIEDKESQVSTPIQVETVETVQIDVEQAGDSKASEVEPKDSTEASLTGNTESGDNLSAPSTIKVVSSPALPKGSRKKRNAKRNVKKKSTAKTTVPEGAP